MYRNSWFLIVISVTAQWRGINTNNATCTTATMQNTSMLQEDIRRINIKKHMTTDKGLRTFRNPRDNESHKEGTTHYVSKTEDHPKKTHDAQFGNSNIESKSEEITNKIRFITKSPHMKESYIQRPLTVLSSENESSKPLNQVNISQFHHKRINRFHTESRRTNTDPVETTPKMKQQQIIKHKELHNIIDTDSQDDKDIGRKPKLRAKSKPKNSNILRSTRINGLHVKKSTVTRRTTKKRSPNVSTSEDLNPYAIEKQMKRLVRRYRDIMNITIEVIDKTIEYNSIVLLKITEAEQADTYFRVKENKYADEVPEKKIIFIVHGLSVMGMKHLIGDENLFHKLLKYYTDKHLEKFDIFLIPMANPDGYAAICNSQAGQYWNKNMAPQTSCPGVALDRNFDVAWNHTQKISSCSPVYPGSMPFSEAETRAVRNVLHQYSHKIVAYIHVHASSYDEKIFKGDAILYPRGYTESQTDDDKYIDLKGDIDEAMKNSTFRILSVTTDTLYNWYGKVSGTSVDYASTVYGVPYAMEFVMQIYNGIQHHALDAIWRVLIDVVFNNIWKNLHVNTNDFNKNN